MKVVLQHVFFMILFMFANANVIKAQSPTDFFNAFSKSDFNLIQSYFGSEVDLCIKDTPQINTKNQALTRLKELVANEPIKSIEALHQGNSKEKSSGYRVAKMTTNLGVYRLFVYSENENGVLRVKEVRIDKF